MASHRCAPAEPPHAAARLPERPGTGEIAGDLRDNQVQWIVASAADAPVGAPAIHLRQRVAETHERAPIAIAQPRRQLIRHMSLAVAVDLMPQRLVVAAMTVPDPRRRLVRDRVAGLEDFVEEVRVFAAA